ncbi:MAG TPA: hypothetical protein VGV36_05290 [Solirubrobacteraceae bacterium]|nr:hypothetical protein [Solirubrobacteraceae bacterium]
MRRAPRAARRAPSLSDTRQAAARRRGAITRQDAAQIARLLLRFADIGQRPADDALAAAAVRS